MELTCDKCGSRMAQLLTSWYCKAECDQREEESTVGFGYMCTMKKFLTTHSKIGEPLYDTLEIAKRAANKFPGYDMIVIKVPLDSDIVTIERYDDDRGSRRSGTVRFKDFQKMPREWIVVEKPAGSELEI